MGRSRSVSWMGLIGIGFRPDSGITIQLGLGIEGKKGDELPDVFK